MPVMFCLLTQSWRQSSVGVIPWSPTCASSPSVSHWAEVMPSRRASAPPLTVQEIGYAEGVQQGPSGQHCAIDGGHQKRPPGGLERRIRQPS